MLYYSYYIIHVILFMFVLAYITEYLWPLVSPGVQELHHVHWPGHLHPIRGLGFRRGNPSRCTSNQSGESYGSGDI